MKEKELHSRLKDSKLQFVNLTKTCYFIQLNTLKSLFFIFVFIGLYSTSLCGQEKVFSKKDSIYWHLYQNNFFKAQKLFMGEKQTLDKASTLYVELILENAFNRNEQSQKLIDKAVQILATFPDTVQHKIYEIKADNEVKLFDYKSALTTNKLILDQYHKLLNKTKKDEIENNIILWEALANTPKQIVNINEEFSCQMIRDKAGLQNLPISVIGDTINFIFDTGANLSTVTQSTAKKMNMSIFPVRIKVGTITGIEVEASLGVCPLFRLGNIEIENAVFIIFEDQYLSFPSIDYQINGILGYPVIAALEEIQIGKNDYFVAGKSNTVVYEINLAMKGLTPLIYLDNMHFTFDTGASDTMFYKKFYEKNKAFIDQNYLPTELSFGGAGGNKSFPGFLINHSFDISGTKVTLTDVQLLKDKVKPDETVYGNIGQDLMLNFNRTIMNFKDMYIKFE